MKKYLVLFFLMFYSVCWSAPSNSISYPNTFTNGTVADASQVNANFNEAQSKFNVHTHTDLTALGTITTGTWASTVIGTTYGGTGQDFSAILQGSLPYFSGTGIFTTLSKDTNSTRYLSNQGTSNNPSWNQVNLTNGVTGVLPFSNGGWTGLGTWSSGLNYNQTYQAATDGFVVGGVACTVNGTLNVKTDSSTPPTTLRVSAVMATNTGMSYCVPVKKNDYYLVNNSDGTVSGVVEYFIPLGA